jgi:hypothetical protein
MRTGLSASTPRAATPDCKESQARSGGRQSHPTEVELGLEECLEYLVGLSALHLNRVDGDVADACQDRQFNDMLGWSLAGPWVSDVGDWLEGGRPATPDQVGGGAGVEVEEADSLGMGAEKAAGIDRQHKLRLAAIRLSVEEPGKPVGMQPEVDLAVEQPDPLADRHISEQLGELAGLERFLVADHGAAVARMLQVDGVGSVLGEQLGASRLRDLEQLNKAGSAEQPVGLDARPAAIGCHVVQPRVVVDQLVDLHVSAQRRFRDGTG